jgi:hypothetical protein
MIPSAEFPMTVHAPRKGDQVVITSLSALLVPGTGYNQRHVRQVLDHGDVGRDRYARPTWHVLTRLTAGEVCSRLDEPLRDYCDAYWTDLTVDLACVGPDGVVLDGHSRRYGPSANLVHGQMLVYPVEFWRPELQASDNWPEIDCRRLLEDYFMLEVDSQNKLPLSQLETHLATDVVTRYEDLERLLVVRPAAGEQGFSVRGFVLQHLPCEAEPVDPEDFRIDEELNHLGQDPNL